MSDEHEIISRLSSDIGRLITAALKEAFDAGSIRGARIGAEVEKARFLRMLGEMKKGPIPQEPAHD